MSAEAVFWLSLALVAYAYAGYPLLATTLARRRGTAPATGDERPPLTVVIAAWNEEARIGARVRDVLAQDYPADRLDVLVVSDGSTDGTAAAARVDPRVHVLELEDNEGKACALNAALERVRTPVVVFTDARQQFAPGALAALVAPFADPDVGAVSGELRIDGGAGGVGLYWRLETRLRLAEACLGWLHGVSGSIWALRTPLFRPLPPGTILDDMWLPCHVALAGRRVWMTREAAAIDSASADADEEFVRKLRTLAGNWQLLARLPVLLVPWRNPVFFAWCSHKFLRLLAPWGLLTALVAAAFGHGGFYRLAFVAQLVAYAAAFAGLLLPRLAARVRVLNAASAFLLLNLAAFLSLPAALAWKPARLWKKH